MLENSFRSPRTQAKSRACSVQLLWAKVEENWAVMGAEGLNQSAKRIVQEPQMAVKHT